MFNRCVVPELAVKYKSKIWKDEKYKFKAVPYGPETESCLKDMITAREESKKRKKEVMQVRVGRRRFGVGTMGKLPGPKLD